MTLVRVKQKETGASVVRCYSRQRSSMGGRANATNNRQSMNKKAVFGTAAVLLVAGYGAATWYLGERAHSAYQEAVADIGKLAGAEALVSQQYTKGFWSSQAQLVLQWTPPVSEEGEEEGGDASAATAQPIRITLENTVRHGPLAGWRLAAAVIETRLGAVEGVSDGMRQAFAKVSAPTVTTVRRFTGSHDIVLAWPAGEIGDGGNLVRWQPLAYQMNLNSDRSRLSGHFAWPDLAVDLSHNEAEDDDVPAAAEAPAMRFAMAFQGMKGDFDMELQDGLWLLAPGHAKGTLGKVTATRTAAAGAAPQPLVALQDLSYGTTISRSGTQLSLVGALRGTGSIGTVALESLEVNETVSRIDVDAVKLLQTALVAAYRADQETALVATEAPWGEALAQAAPKFVAALPAYAVKLSAKMDGEQGELEYGLEIKNAPNADEIAAGGWVPALLKSSALHANLRLPKAWLPRLAQAAGQKAPKPEDIDAMVGMAQAQGFVKQEAAHLTSALRVEGGKTVLNGKEIALPFGRH